jgi:endonuclease/exonuclease/phosphatase family metal-dependent hydrolase
VATYNIHGCVGMDRRYAPDRVAAVVNELGAEVVGLQEVDTRRPQHENLHQLDYIEKVTGLTAVAGANIREARGDYGNALLSAWPVAAVRRHDLSHSRREPRGALDVDLATPAGLLRVIVTHLGLGWGERKQQIMRLLQAVEPLADRPTLLMGDFNDWLPRGGPHLRRLKRFFAASYGGRSYPAPCPMLALDHIYAHPAPAEATARVHASATARRASDHLPVTLRFAWPARAGDHKPAMAPLTS